MDALTLSQKLLRCPSITPHNEGALEVVAEALTGLGFTCERFDHEGICNLYASYGSGSPHLCFAGHTDVVPLGDATLWTCDPFGAEIKQGQLWGRGAADMKCAIACFISAIATFLKTSPLSGTLSLLITGDEEGAALYGTQYVLPFLEERGAIPDLCLIGEPTSLNVVGDTLKVGRRGTVTGTLTCYGKQGHIAYPQNTDNPIPRLLKCLTALNTHVFDKGTDVFEPTRLEITSIDTDNPATNIIPQKTEAKFGIRINTLQTGEKVCETVKTLCEAPGGKHELALTMHGNAFLTEDPKMIDLMQQAVASVTGTLPDLNTTGGATDGRFISKLCPVIECGMREETMHQIDEHVGLEDIQRLTEIYGAILKTFFKVDT